MVRASDWLIDLGPEGGDAGGLIVAQGTPEDIIKEPRSHTGKFLKDVLARRPLPEAEEPKAKKAGRREAAE